MLDALERIVADLSELDGGAELDRARVAFHERTGEFEVADRWYEERIGFFFDWFLCDFGGAARWLDVKIDAETDARRIARACTRSARSLYRVRSIDEGVLLDDLLGGARFALDPGAAARLTVGDVFDGRLLVVDAIALAPGIIFHPPETHEALDELLQSLTPFDGERGPVLDGLLRMRMRLDRFTSIRARHIYRHEALDERDILSAGWARKRRDPGALPG